MASEYFKRMRAGRKGEASAPDIAAAVDASLNPWTEWTPPQPVAPEHPNVSPVASDPRADAYASWAARMQEKRSRTQAKIANAQDGVRWATLGAAPETDSSGYWTTDVLFAESQRVAEEELTSRPNPWRVAELLAVLDLRDDASPQQIADAYKSLAKAHHPDRFVSADEATQQFHADRMTSINRAYHALRQLERV